jgi:hypothetical protein
VTPRSGAISSKVVFRCLVTPEVVKWTPHQFVNREMEAMYASSSYEVS